jgi:hypothetical protein
VVKIRGQYEELSCPFCDKGKIQAWYIPGVWTEKRTGKSSLGRGKSVIKSTDVWLIKSGCSICGKLQEEVEKELRKKGVI